MMNARESQADTKFAENWKKAYYVLRESGRIASIPNTKRLDNVNLNSQAMFDSLVELYVSFFEFHLHDVKPLVDIFPMGGAAADCWKLTAQVYISHWFLDLYTSNRESVKIHSPPAFSQHYHHETVMHSYEYDQFLVLLNACIRPTHVKGPLGEELFIPVISEKIDWDSDNPFSLDNFTSNFDLFRTLIEIMKEGKRWRMGTIETKTLGRPSWLFDWHGTHCCVWFPLKENYTIEDVSVAYILGVPCTPNLGPRDVDDWQDFPTGSIPAQINVGDYHRIRERSFFGAYEERTVEAKMCTMFIPGVIGEMQKKRKANESQASEGSELAECRGELVVPRYRITNWIYYCRVITCMERGTRYDALHTLLLLEDVL